MQHEDVDLNPIFERVQANSRPHPKNDGDNFFVQEGLLMRHTDGFPRIALPRALHSSVIRAHHTSIYGIHTIRSTLKTNLLAKYWHPHLVKSISNLTISCTFCLAFGQHNRPGDDRGILPKGQARELWFCDLARVSSNPDDDTTVLLAMDSKTTYCFVYPLADKTPKSIMSALLQLKSSFDARVIKFDNEAGLMPIIFDLRNLGIQVMRTATNSPQSNGPAEKKIGQLKVLLRNLHQMEPSLSVAQKCMLAVRNLNDSCRSDFGVPPSLRMFGNSLPQPIDVLSVSEDSHDDEAVKAVLERQIEKFRARREQSERLKQAARNPKRASKVKIGDIVWCHRGAKQVLAGHALSSPYDGPLRVDGVEEGGYSALCTNLATKVQSKRRTCRLFPFLGPADELHLNSQWDNQFAQLPSELQRKGEINSIFLTIPPW